MTTALHQITDLHDGRKESDGTYWACVMDRAEAERLIGRAVIEAVSLELPVSFAGISLKNSGLPVSETSADGATQAADLVSFYIVKKKGRK